MGNAGSTPVFYASRPTISLDGQDNAQLKAGIMAFLVEETTAGLFRCEATFVNWGSSGDNSANYLYFDREILDFGKTLAVRTGVGDAESQIFEGRITGIEAHYTTTRPPDVVVLAEDRFQDLRMTRRTRTFEDITDSDVIQQIASQHNLNHDIDINGPSYTVLSQVNQSDLAFIRERARAIDAEVWVEGKTLKARARNSRSNNDVILTYQSGLKEFSVIADLANQRTSLTISGWDTATKEAIKYEASESAISSELNGSKSGGSILQRTFGVRAEQLVHLVPFTTLEAQSLAEAHYRRMARKFVTGYGIAHGDGRIRVGTHLNLKGLGTLFEGEYYVTEVRHTFNEEDGYLTHFAAEKSGIE
jgi:phage protein D